MIGRFFTVFGYFGQLVAAKLLGRPDRCYDIICRAVGQLGGVYVKLLQFTCLRTDIFPDEKKMQFLSFYDEVPIEPLDVSAILKKELGPEKMEEFTMVASDPFASGTFGQVYHATLRDGSDVIIKIKREDLVLKLRVDFFLLRCLARIVTLLFDPKIVDVLQLVREFEESTYQELDYVKEVAHAGYFYRVFRNNPHLLIPKTYESLSTSCVLVQEYVPGISLTSLIRFRQETGPDRYREWLTTEYQTDIYTVIKNIAFDMGIGALVADRFYADPHPGNIKILPNNRYALIDFGIIGVSPKNKRTYYNIVSQMIKHADAMDLAEVGKEFLKWGAGRLYRQVQVLDDHFSVGSAGLAETIAKRYEQMLEHHREKFRRIEETETENFVKLYLDIIQTGQFLGVKIPEGLLATMKSVAIYKSWVTFLEPTFHHMRETYQRILSAVDGKKLTNADDTTPSGVGVEEAMEGLLDWAGKIAEKDAPLYLRLARQFEETNYV